MSYFPEEPLLKKYRIKNFNLELILSRGVFPPSDFGRAFAENIFVNPSERFIDIGTGSGIIAITAAKLGVDVTAADICPEAAAIAKRNAARNSVSVDSLLGEYFASSTGKYDVIPANLPREILRLHILKGLVLLPKLLTEAKTETLACLSF